jgi:DNA-binding MarR family transcriptional regulator
MELKRIRKFRQIIRHFDRELHFQHIKSCCNGISFAQCHTLLEIENNLGISVSELAKNLSLDKSTTSRTVDGLVNIGLVDRQIPKDNRRMATLSLTAQGLKTCENINFFNDKYVAAAIEGFTNDELNVFLGLFEKLSLNMAKVRKKVTDCNDKDCCL